jgi:hypothetical protein
MIIKIGQEPIEPEPEASDNLTEREPKSPMIASPATDDCKPLHVSPGIAPPIAPFANPWTST